MKRVTGIGGIFFKAKDPVALRTWYQKHLGIDVQDWGGAAFRWADAEGNSTAGTTIWNVSDASGNYFAPSTSSFMVNYRVADLHALVHELRKEGCNVLDKTEESEYGKFGWVIDPEGNKVELWEPPVGQ
jgi:predicted enzyme related to lactoylglutathione lyase